MKRILVLAPHTDDGEFGCGGSINKMVNLGYEVTYAAFSPCRNSVRKGLPSDILIKEVKKATHVLGVDPKNLILFDYDVRTFSYRRQEILEDMVKLKRGLNPDIVFMPTLHDMHQDHATVAQEGLRAFKFSSILCYEMPWNNLNFTTSSFFHLDQGNAQKKVDALKEYQSQSHRPYANEEFILSWLRTRGVQIGAKYAEAFEVLRWIM